MVFKESAKCVLRDFFIKSFKDVSRIFKWSFFCNFVAWISSQLPEQMEGLFSRVGHVIASVLDGSLTATTPFKKILYLEGWRILLTVDERVLKFLMIHTPRLLVVLKLWKMSFPGRLESSQQRTLGKGAVQSCSAVILSSWFLQHIASTSESFCWKLFIYLALYKEHPFFHCSTLNILPLFCFGWYGQAVQTKSHIFQPNIKSSLTKQSP